MNTTSTPANNEISNPVVCLEQGDVLAFKVFINEADRTQSNYPVYVKDHMFNTNPDFDYGAFRQLGSYIRETNITLSVFMHVFSDGGTYVFADAQDVARFVQGVASYKRNAHNLKIKCFMNDHYHCRCIIVFSSLQWKLRKVKLVFYPLLTKLLLNSIFFRNAFYAFVKLLIKGCVNYNFSVTAFSFRP